MHPRSRAWRRDVHDFRQLATNSLKYWSELTGWLS